MIFQWDPEVPLVVDENIELPQLQLVKNQTADCTQVYSTGIYFNLLLIVVNIYKIIYLHIIYIGYRRCVCESAQHCVVDNACIS